MKKLLFLSSALLMTMAGAHSADLVEGAITGGANTCTVDVLKVYENNATANTIATWSPVTYTCTPGQYLLQTETSVECTECPVGSYCPGGEFTVETNTSITQCPDTYTSDTGATGENECYIGCELACSTNVECPPHSKNCTHSEFKTAGRQYVDATCNAYPSVCPIADFGCDVGYNKINITSQELEERYSSFEADDSLAVISCHPANFDETDGKHINPFISSDVALPDNGINDCELVKPGQTVFITNDYALLFQIFFSDRNPDNVTGIESVLMPDNRYCTENCLMLPLYYLENGNLPYEITGGHMWWTWKSLSVPNPARTEILNRAISEMETTGSITSETNTMLEQTLPTQALQIYQNLLQNIGTLNLDQVNMISGAILFLSMDEIETELPVIYIGDNMEVIPEDTGSAFAFGVHKLITFMYSLYWDILVPDHIVSTCTNNTINIDWNPGNGGEHTQNMCIYDGPVTLPSDPVRPGYTFMGWKLVE